MSMMEKIGYTVGALLPMLIIASVIAPSFMSIENGIRFERAIDDILLGLLGITLIFIIFVAPVIASVLLLITIWSKP